MLKFLLWFLLVTNAGLFALQRGYLDAFLPDQPDPQRLQLQRDPERLRLLSFEAATAPVAVAAPVTLACIELGDFSEPEAVHFEAALGALDIRSTPVRRRLAEEPASQIVFIPSQGDKEGADRKSAELRRLGVKDFYVLQTAGERHFGISLGVFRSRGAADVRLAELTRQGVRSARIGAFGNTGSRFAMQLHDLDDAGVTAAIELAATVAKVARRECAAR